MHLLFKNQINNREMNFIIDQVNAIKIRKHDDHYQLTDNDFNDLVVEVELNCEELEEPTNTAPLADAGPDQIITLPSNLVQFNGENK